MAEIEYLKKCKKKLPATFDFISFSTRNRRLVLTWHREATSKVIDALLRQSDGILALVRENQNAFAYDRESEKQAVEGNLRISRALLGTNIKIEQKHYKRIQINF